VLLLDEFEKCHPKVHDRFLQLTDEGSFLNGAGESVSCGSMIMIATSNAGAEIYRSPAIGFLPPVPPGRVIKHGNASVRGAKALLLSKGARARLETLVGRIEHVELESEPDFFDLFVEGFRFAPIPAGTRNPGGSMTMEVPRP